MIDLLRDLCAVPGTCGHENPVISHIASLLPDKSCAHIDGLGNLIVKVQGAFEGPTLILSAHSDEVGFIVKKIEPSGLLRFEKVGGNDNRSLVSQQVIVSGSKGPVYGVTGNISAHMSSRDDVNRVRKHTEMYIDIGAADADEVKRLGVRIGDPITWATPVRRIGENRLLGKAFDDRAGCAVLLKAMEALDASKLHGCVYFCFSVQEELGLRGAQVLAESIKADVAIAVDTTAASDTPEAMMDKTVCLGKGPCIKVMDNSLMASLKVRSALQDLAEKAGMPYQLEILLGIGTDAGALHKAPGGLPTGVISIPSRYAHSSCEVLDICDLEGCVKLLSLFIENFAAMAPFKYSI